MADLMTKQKRKDQINQQNLTNNRAGNLKRELLKMFYHMFMQVLFLSKYCPKMSYFILHAWSDKEGNSLSVTEGCLTYRKSDLLKDGIFTLIAPFSVSINISRWCCQIANSAEEINRAVECEVSAVWSYPDCSLWPGGCDFWCCPRLVLLGWQPGQHLQEWWTAQLDDLHWLVDPTWYCFFFF